MCMLHEQRTWGLLTSVSVSYKVKPLGHKADKTPHLNPNCWSPQSLTITLSIFFFFYSKAWKLIFIIESFFLIERHKD